MDKKKFTPDNNIKIFIAVSIIIFATILRGLAIGIDGLWLDEVFGASFANLNAFEIVVAVFRFDIHPPFYYLQLGAWAALSNNDMWLLCNSIAWSLATLCLASYGVFRLSYPQLTPTFISAISIAVLGSEIYYASELRMYTMISCLAILGWIRADIWSLQPTTKNTIYLLFVIALISGTHSISFIPISSILLYATVAHLTNNKSISIKKIAVISVCSALILAPWLINASFRSISHTSLPTPDGILKTFSGWFLGYGNVAIPEIIRYVAGAFIIYLALLMLVRGDRNLKILTFAFVIWPSLTLIFISVLIRPVWIDRALVFSAPFFVIAMSLFWRQSYFSDKNFSIKKYYALALIGCIFSLSFLAWWQATTPRKMQYREAAEYITSNNTDNIPIWIPENFTFWGMARYLHKPDWGNLLQIQDPIKPDQSETWEKIYARLGPVWLERLHLQALTRHITTGSGVMWIGLSRLPKEISENGIWVVGNNNLTEHSACNNSTPLHVKKFRGVVVIHCASL